MSGLLPMATVARTSEIGSFVPKAAVAGRPMAQPVYPGSGNIRAFPALTFRATTGLMRRSNLYSITSSARASNAGEFADHPPVRKFNPKRAVRSWEQPLRAFLRGQVRIFHQKSVHSGCHSVNRTTLCWGRRRSNYRRRPYLNRPDEGSRTNGDELRHAQGR